MRVAERPLREARRAEERRAMRARSGKKTLQMAACEFSFGHNSSGSAKHFPNTLACVFPLTDDLSELIEYGNIRIY